MHRDLPSVGFLPKCLQHPRQDKTEIKSQKVSQVLTATILYYLAGCTFTGSWLGSTVAGIQIKP